jgi:ribosome-associated protein
MKSKRPPKPRNDDALEIARLCRTCAENKKGYATTILDVRGISSVTDYFVICSGDVQPQLRAIAGEIERTLREKTGRRVLGADGLRGSNWMVLDYGDVVVHIFQHPVRVHYGIEQLWSDAPRAK